MANKKNKKKNEEPKQGDTSIHSDPETLNKTDPQEHMKGPVSSLVEKIGESFDDNTKKKSR